MIKGLRTTIYKVGNLEQAKRWYSDVLNAQPYFEEPFYVGFNVGGFELGLDPDTEDVTAGTNLLVYWGVDDAQKSFKELLDKGATVHAAPQNVGGDIVVASVFDPFGNVFGVIENPGFKIENSE
jgi:predicted enzyme related to lactoylglutathione lyase